MSVFLQNYKKRWLFSVTQLKGNFGRILLYSWRWCHPVDTVKYCCSERRKRALNRHTRDIQDSQSSQPTTHSVIVFIEKLSFLRKKMRTRHPHLVVANHRWIIFVCTSVFFVCLVNCDIFILLGLHCWQQPQENGEIKRLHANLANEAS